MSALGHVLLLAVLMAPTAGLVALAREHWPWALLLAAVQFILNVAANAAHESATRKAP